MFEDFVRTGVLSETKAIARENSTIAIVKKYTDGLFWVKPDVNNHKLRIYDTSYEDQYNFVEHFLEQPFKEEEGTDYFIKYCKKYNIQFCSLSDIFHKCMLALREKFVIEIDDLETVFYSCYLAKKFNIEVNSEDIDNIEYILNDKYNKDVKILLCYIFMYLLISKPLDNKYEHTINVIKEELLHTSNIVSASKGKYLRYLLPSMIKFAIDNRINALIDSLKATIKSYFWFVGIIDENSVMYIVKLCNYRTECYVKDKEDFVKSVYDKFCEYLMNEKREIKDNRIKEFIINNSPSYGYSMKMQKIFNYSIRTYPKRISFKRY